MATEITRSAVDSAGTATQAAPRSRRLTLFGVSNKLRSAEQRAAGVPAFVADLMPAISAGKIRPIVDRVFAFEQLAQARGHMKANRHLGKIVITMPPSNNDRKSP